MCQASSHVQFAVFACQIHHLCHGIFKKMRLHAGSTYGADFFLIYQNTAHGTVGHIAVQHRLHGSVSTDPVILTVSQCHAAVKACFSCFSCRNDLQLCGNEILFMNIVGLFQNIQNTCLYCFFSGFFLVLLLIFLIDQQRLIAYDDIQSFTLDNLCCLFLQLLLCQMDQQIGHEEYRIILVLTNIDFYTGAVLFHDDSVDCQWNGHPLVLLHATVIMGVQISESTILIQGILLYIQSGAVDMGSKDVHALCHGFTADLEHGDGFVHPYAVYLISGFKSSALFDQALQFTVTGLLNGIDNGVNALSLGLTVV